MSNERKLKDSEANRKLLASTRRIKKFYQFGAAFVCVLMVGVSIGLIIRADAPTGFPTVIEPGSLVGICGTIIFEDNAVFYAKNGTTGAIDDSDSNFTELLQGVIDDSPSHGTLIGLIAYDDAYPLDGPISLVSGIQLIGYGNPTIEYELDGGVAFETPEQFGVSYASLSVNAAIGDIDITVNNGALFAEGDWVKIVSNRTVSGYNRGELTQIRAIAGNVLTLVRSLDDNYYTTDPTWLREVQFTNDLSFSNLILTGSGTEKETTLLNGTHVSGCHITDCQVSEWGETALRFTDSVNVWVDGCIFENNFYTGLGYSIILADATEKVRITNSVFRYYGRHYIATGTYTDTSNFPGGMYRDCVISGNTFESSQTANEAINNHPCSYGQMTITDNTFRSCGKGIELRNAYGVISSNYFFDCETGVDVLDGDESRSVAISGNTFSTMVTPYEAVFAQESNVTVEGNLFYNARVTVDAWVNNTQILDNKFMDCLSNTAIETLGTSAQPNSNLLVSGNEFVRCGVTSGEYVLKPTYCNGLQVSNNLFSSSARFYTLSSDYILVTGNHISGTASHGMEFGACKNITITDNFISSGSSRGISLVSASIAATPVTVTDNTIITSGSKIYNDGSYTNVAIHNNIGYITENAGAATVTGAVSTVTVSHGLATTPTSVIVTGNNTGIGYYFVTSVSSTQFVITFENQPGTSEWKFYWYAEV